MNRTILVVAAHPDDEVLGVGGTMARHVTEGDKVGVLFLSDGVGSRSTVVDDGAAFDRRTAAGKACALLGAEILGFESFPDNCLDTIPLLSLVKAVDRIKVEIKPDIIYTHHFGDLNIDHRLASQAVLTAFRPQPAEKYTEILAFEVLSSTEWNANSLSHAFLPDTYVNIADQLELLMRAYECYQAEIRPDPHARSMEALRIAAMHRGRQVGMYAAESFMTLRRLIR